MIITIIDIKNPSGRTYIKLLGFNTNMGRSELPVEQETIEKYICEWLDRGNAPGVSVSLVSSSDILYMNGFGSRDRSSNTPVTPKTVFGIGSCTKSVTAIAVLQLVDEGKYSLTDPVEKYLPFLEVIPGEEITIHDLLSHGTGMPSDGHLSGLLTQLTGRGGGKSSVPVADKADLHRHVAQFSEERVTDDEWYFYYNTGFTLLGELVETCSGQSYAEYVQENILDPLGMSRSCFSREQFETLSDRMTPYRMNDGSLIEDELVFDELLYPAGGLFSCATNMVQYLQMMMRGGELNEQCIVPKDLITELTTGHTPWSTSIDGTKQEYGYGVTRQSFLDDILISHGGMMETTTAWLGYLREADRGVFIACNTTPEKPLGELGKTILALTQKTDPHTVVPRLILDRKIEPLTGTYTTPRKGMSATVSRHGGGVRIHADNPGWNQEYVATPESLEADTHEFRSVGADGTVEPISFDVADDKVTLRVGRWQLYRQSSTTE